MTREEVEAYFLRQPERDAQIIARLRQFHEGAGVTPALRSAIKHTPRPPPERDAQC